MPLQHGAVKLDNTVVEQGIKRNLLKFFRRIHVWLGLFAGTLFGLMGVTGAIVVLRPQIALWLAPPPASPGNCRPDWDHAEQQVLDYAQTPINRLYAPPADDPRYAVCWWTSSKRKSVAPRPEPVAESSRIL